MQICIDQEGYYLFEDHHHHHRIYCIKNNINSFFVPVTLPNFVANKRVYKSFFKHTLAVVITIQWEQVKLIYAYSNLSQIAVYSNLGIDFIGIDDQVSYQRTNHSAGLKNSSLISEPLYKLDSLN